MNKKHITYAILVLVFILAVIPWLKEGVPSTDDYRHHAMRFWFIQEQLSQNNFSEWMPHIYGGWPFFHFYHPMFYILTLPISLLLNPIVALKASTILAYAIALFGTFYASKLLFKDDDIALISTVAYFMSSHFLFHATVAGALPRLTAIAITPLAMALFIKALHEKKSIAISGAVLSALFMMHTSVAVPAFIICGVYAIYSSFTTKNMSSIKKMFAIFIIAIGISAAWFIPLMLEKDYGNFPGGNEIVSPNLDQSFRTFGITRPADHFVRSNYFGFSVLILSLLSFLLINKNKTINLLKAGLVVSVVLYFNLFGILGLSSLIKTALTGSSVFFISTIVFNAALLAGAAGKSISDKYENKYLAFIIAAIILIELYPGLNAFSYGWSNQSTESFVNPPELIDAWSFVKEQPGNFVVFSAVGVSAEMYHGKQEFGFDWEGCPQCVQKETYALHNDIWKNFTKGIKNDELLGYLGVKYYVVPCNYKLNNKLAYTNNAICVYENEEFRPLIESNSQVSNIKYELDGVSFDSKSAKESKAVIKINYFKPHWHAYVNEKEVQITETWPEFMEINLPAGDNKVNLEYQTNSLHIASWFITFLTIILTIYFTRK